MTRPILVLDFDGTVCLGDDPVRFYAQEVAAAAPRHGERVLSGLTEFLRGAKRPFGAEDAYQAIALTGADAGVGAEELDRAYHASRERVARGEGVMHTPEGFEEFLIELRGVDVRTVLLTNAPATGAFGWLEDQNLLSLLDDVITDAGKPDNMAAHVRSLLEAHDLTSTPERLGSVGDVWANDIAPAMELGARGFYIDRFGFNAGPSTARGSTFPELYRSILEWANFVTEP